MHAGPLSANVQPAAAHIRAPGRRGEMHHLYMVVMDSFFGGFRIWQLQWCKERSPSLCQKVLHLPPHIHLPTGQEGTLTPTLCPSRSYSLLLFYLLAPRAVLLWAGNGVTEQKSAAPGGLGTWRVLTLQGAPSVQWAVGDMQTLYFSRACYFSSFQLFPLDPAISLPSHHFLTHPWHHQSSRQHPECMAGPGPKVWGCCTRV